MNKVDYIIFFLLFNFVKLFERFKLLEKRLFKFSWFFNKNRNNETWFEYLAIMFLKKNILKKRQLLFLSSIID